MDNETESNIFRLFGYNRPTDVNMNVGPNGGEDRFIAFADSYENYTMLLRTANIGKTCYTYLDLAQAIMLRDALTAYIDGSDK